MKYKCLFLIYMYLFFCTVAYGKDIYFQHIDMAQTSTQTSAISIYQDEKGALWFGNEQLNVYDGTDIRSFNLSGHLQALGESSVHTICGDGKYKLFLLVDKDIISYDMVSGQFFNDSIKAEDIVYRQGYLYYCRTNQLFRYHTGTHEKELLCTLGSEVGRILHICFYGEGWLMGTSRGLYIYEGGQVRTLLSDKKITGLFVDRQNRTWVAIDGEGIFIYEKDEWISLSEVCPSVATATKNQVRCFEQDKNGSVWIGSFGGITVVDADLQSAYLLVHDKDNYWSIRHSSVYAIFRDGQDNMWIGTYYGGLSYFNPMTEDFSFYQVEGKKGQGNTLKGFSFGRMIEDADENLYIATENGGLNILDRRTNRVKHLDPEKGECPFYTAKSVWYDQKHNSLYVGSFLHGLYCYKDGKFKQVGSDVLQNAQQRIVSQLIPWNGQLIVATQEGFYLLNLQTQKLSLLFTDEELQAKTRGIVRFAYLDTKQQLWVSVANRSPMGIDLKSNTEIDCLVLQQRIGTKAVQCITADGQGRLYWTVNGGGMLAYIPERQQLEEFSQENGMLLTNSVFQVAVLDSHLVLTSPKGITLIDLETKKATHTLFNKGFPLHSINVTCGLYVAPSDSTIFVGGIEGMMSVKVSALADHDKPYHIMFNSLVVNNNPVTPSAEGILKENMPYVSELELSHHQNNFSIGFTSTNYRSTNSELFEYKLEGWDKQWIHAPYPTVTYSGLTPGKYNLLVRDPKNHKEITLKIVIHPPFYASIYAYCLYVLLVILIVRWFIRYNKKQAVLQASLEQESREKERIDSLNQAKLKFYVNISHELRTPLTLMSSLLELVLQNQDMNNTIRGKLQKVRQYTLQMQQLITELLDIRRLEQGKMPLQASPQNIIEYSKHIFGSFRDYAVMNRIQYKMEYVEPELFVWFDPLQIQKVLNNLLLNAFKFTPAEGCICLSIVKKENTVQLIVSDTGCGIKEEELGRVFDRFYQADNYHENVNSGSGIGLALTRDIVEQHKGTIVVESEIGKGTRFIVTLLLGENHLADEQKTRRITPIQVRNPFIILSASEQGEEEAPSDESEERQEKARKVLLVDDNRDMLQILGEAFSMTYQVYTAYNGEQAIELAEKEQPDIIVSDVMMPGITGLEMCRRLKKKMETSHIPIILLTARDSMESAVEGLKCGANDYIIKPFNIEMLLLKCNNVISLIRKQQQSFRTEVEIDVSSVSTNKMEQKLLEDSINLIRENLQNNEFNIDYWCKEVAIGRTRLNGKIKSLTGLTLNDFILQIRLQKCAELLSDPELSISEIAWQAGFSSGSYMGKCFKERFGITPLQYRNQQHSD
ncbi:response regulator [Phocaeicola sp.]